MSNIDVLNTLRWRHNGCDSVSNHQPHDCLLNRLFRRGSKKTSKRRDTGLCAGNSLGTGEFPAQMASNAENVSIWWRHHAYANCPKAPKPTLCIPTDLYFIYAGNPLGSENLIWHWRTRIKRQTRNKMMPTRNDTKYHTFKKVNNK